MADIKVHVGDTAAMPVMNSASIADTTDQR